MSNLRAFEVPSHVPVEIGDVSPANRMPLPEAMEYKPERLFGEDSEIMSVAMPNTGGTGGGLDVEFKEMVNAELALIDQRLYGLENEPDPTSIPTGPAGGVLGGEYPNPSFAQPMATQTALETGLGMKQDRYSPRLITANAIANVGELIRADASLAPLQITPPPGAENGDIVSVIKIDNSENSVFWNGAVNSDASAEMVGQWTGATFVLINTVWLVLSVNTSYSAAPTSTGGTGTGLTREQADARYELLGVAQQLVEGITKETLGLGNVNNTSDLSKPISTAVQAALNNKADKSSTISVSTAGSVTLDASLGNFQAISAVNNIVLNPPINPVDQQAMRVEVYATSGADKTVTTTSGISNGSGLGLPFTVKSGRFAILGLVYSARATRWMLVSYTVEPG